MIYVWLVIQFICAAWTGWNLHYIRSTRREIRLLKELREQDRMIEAFMEHFDEPEASLRLAKPDVGE
jgi:hypothetical protein